MRYLRLAVEERQALLARLEAMPDWVEGTFAALSRVEGWRRTQALAQ